MGAQKSAAAKLWQGIGKIKHASDVRFFKASAASHRNLPYFSQIRPEVW